MDLLIRQRIGFRHAGQVGYVICGMKSASEAHIGDTFHHIKSKIEPLPGFEAAKSMVSWRGDRRACRNAVCIETTIIGICRHLSG
jgi:hypothetical protein